ncbi:23S rRNA G2069 N7-methylase RlmK/C1962 C5-methylase RlmI [Methanococcus voltae]|uniref:hypothetical protein n=1 Tax=Methanococcus voltae TaxID=2188 RepID=UPI001AE57EED|nr:hypothetical protein [Methanococcus voltae]MBP2143441.1 23S rRNA G2069 N7-methylase RlmK/C1962 C5-methylase RlmI [Methanococcus voltae]
MDLPKNKLYTLLGVIVVILIAFGAIAIFTMGYLTPSSVTVSSEDDEVVKQYDMFQIKGEALDIDYKDLKQQNEEYVNKIIHYRGQIIKVNDSDWESYLTMATKKSSENYYDGNDVKVRYLIGDLDEGAIIDVYGEYRGLTWADEESDYEAIPLIYATVIDCNNKTILC